MTDTANMMLTLADAIENGNPNEDDGTLVLDAEQCCLIVQTLRDKATSMQVDQDRSAHEKPLVHIDQDRLVKHVEAALDLEV